MAAGRGFDHIIIASDLSLRSERALRRGLRLADQFDARVTLLHVVDKDLPESLAHHHLQEAQQALGALAASISDRPVTLRVELDEPVSGIVRATQELGCDLLCLGVHRHREIWDLFVGSTMERIVHAVHFPVLLVRDAVDHAYDALLCGIDFSQASDAALRSGLALAPKARVRLFHAFHVPFRGYTAPTNSEQQIAPFRREAEARLEAWWDQADLPARVARPTPVAEGRHRALMQEMQAFQPDLLALGAHARSGLRMTRLGSFTQEILRDPACDVLVLRG